MAVILVIIEMFGVRLTQVDERLGLLIAHGMARLLGTGIRVIQVVAELQGDSEEEQLGHGKYQWSRNQFNA